MRRRLENRTMSKPYINLQPSEAVLAQIAGRIFAAYITVGRVPAGQEPEWITRSIQEAFQIVRQTDDSFQSDAETA
jgi:hypothetical protein